MFKHKKVGLALGGGGARGIAHVGVLSHLESIGLRPDMIAGTSAGAIIGTLYAFGFTPQDILADLAKLKPIELQALRIPKLGFAENIGLKDLLEKKLGKDTKIEDSPIPLAYKATDLKSGNSILINRGPVVEGILASSCVPGIYIPVKRDNMLLVDGGLTENVPVRTLKELGAEIKIAVDLNGLEGYQTPAGIFDVLANALDIAIDHQTKEQINEADVVISMDLSRYSRFSSVHADELYRVGKETAEKVIPSSDLIKQYY